VKSQWVREEARLARDKGKLIPVLIEEVSVPLGFGEVQAAHLTDWNGDPNNPGWRRLAQAVSDAAGIPLKTAAAARPSPVPPLSSFFTGAAAQPVPSGGDLSPVDYIKKCFAHYVDGKGRARRAEWWWFFLFSLIGVIVAAVLDVALFGTNSYTGAANAPVFTLLFSFGILCPSVSVGVRRLHDIGVSGWLYIPIAIGYFFLIGGLVMLVIALVPSKPEANQYGPNPKLAPNLA
jgi:uncharacterized membrane protein YhaH (DUF805 family)